MDGDGQGPRIREEFLDGDGGEDDGGMIKIGGALFGRISTWEIGLDELLWSGLSVGEEREEEEGRKDEEGKEIKEHGRGSRKGSM